MEPLLVQMDIKTGILLLIGQVLQPKEEPQMGFIGCFILGKAHILSRCGKSNPGHWVRDRNKDSA